MERTISMEIFETPYQKERRELFDKITEDYLSYRDLIMSKEVKPFRVQAMLSRKYGMTPFGIRQILNRRGVYIDKDNPCVIPSGMEDAVNRQ